MSQGKWHHQIDANVPAPEKNQENSRNLAVREAIWKLPASAREVIVLRYYNDLSYERMAEVLGISIQAVNGRVIRAKRKLGNILKQ